MMGYKNKDSCRNLFRRLEILPFVSQYAFCSKQQIPTYVGSHSITVLLWIFRDNGYSIILDCYLSLLSPTFDSIWYKQPYKPST